MTLVSALGSCWNEYSKWISCEEYKLDLTLRMEFMTGRTKTCILLSGCRKISAQLQKGAVETVAWMQRCIRRSHPFSKWDEVWDEVVIHQVAL